MINRLMELNKKKYVYTNFELSEPSINHKLPFGIFKNLTSLKQRHFHLHFYRRCYRASTLHIFKLEINYSKTIHCYLFFNGK
jgi:hypothetical protein